MDWHLCTVHLSYTEMVSVSPDMSLASANSATTVKAVSDSNLWWPLLKRMRTDNTTQSNILVNDQVRCTYLGCRKCLISLSQLEAVLFDFELSKIVVAMAHDPDESNVYDTLTRSPSVRWAAPELWRSTRRMDDKSDVWSFALAMVEVFTLNIPWPEEKQNLCHQELPPRPNSDWVTDEVWALMQECGKVREERPKMEEVERRLREAERYRRDNSPPPSPPRDDSNGTVHYDS